MEVNMSDRTTVLTPKWYTTAQVAELLGFGLEIYTLASSAATRAALKRLGDSMGELCCTS
jgi:hypothetical protein